MRFHSTLQALIVAIPTTLLLLFSAIATAGDGYIGYPSSTPPRYIGASAIVICAEPSGIACSKVKNSKIILIGGQTIGEKEYTKVRLGAVAELVGNEGGVVSGVFNLESSGVEASDWRPRHDEHYHEA